MEQPQTKKVAAVVATKIFASKDVKVVEKLSNTFLEEIREMEYALMSTTHTVKEDELINVIVYQKPVEDKSVVTIKEL